MIRLFKIEWEKLRNYRAFWVMVGLYLVLLFTIIFGLPVVLDYIAKTTNDNKVVNTFKSIVFNFPDIWQNLAYVAGMRGFIKVFLGILVVNFISNEFSYVTIRTNIMNGISRSEFVVGKLEVLFLLSLISTVAVAISGFYLGITNSPIVSLRAIFGKTEFLAGYFLEVFTYLTFALLIGILIRKTGFAVITLLAYMVIEPIIQHYINDDYVKYLPMNAMNHIIWSPNTSLIKIKTPDFNYNFQEFIAFGDVLTCFGYAVLFTGLIYWYIKSRDL